MHMSVYLLQTLCLHVDNDLTDPKNCTDIDTLLSCET